MNEIKQTIQAKKLGNPCVQEKDGELSGNSFRKINGINNFEQNFQNF